MKVRFAQLISPRGLYGTKYHDVFLTRDVKRFLTKEIKSLEKRIEELKKGKTVLFKARRNKKAVVIKFKLKPTNKILEGKLEAYKEILYATCYTGLVSKEGNNEKTTK